MGRPGGAKNLTLPRRMCKWYEDKNFCTQLQNTQGRSGGMIRTVWKNGCAVLLAAWVLLAGLLPVPAARAAQVQALPDSGMALDVSELTLEMTDDDPRPVAYLSVQAPEEYFFLIWTSSNPAAATVDGTGKVTGRAEGTAVITARNERGEKAACTITVKRARPATRC